jgi:hypothetical protein
MLNDMFAAGAAKPGGYRDPEAAADSQLPDNGPS